MEENSHDAVVSGDEASGRPTTPRAAVDTRLLFSWLRHVAYQTHHDYDEFDTFVSRLTELALAWLEDQGRYTDGSRPEEWTEVDERKTAQTAKSVADWTWRRMRSAGHQDGSGLTPGRGQEVRKKWQRQWALLRAERLEGLLPDVVIAPALTRTGDVGVRWECEACDEVGAWVTSEQLAYNAGRGHVQTHAPAEVLRELEDLKVRRMPVELLSPDQRRRREELARRDG